MAVEFPINVPLNLTNNELRNAILQNLSSAPTGILGKMYFDTSTNSGVVFNGATWVPTDATKAVNIPISALAVNPLARANHTGTQLSATISDLATTVQSYSLSLFAAPTADLSLASHKLTNVSDPVSAQDAATKNYVDTVAQNAAAGIDPKDAVNAATTANITLSGTQTVDGVSLAVGDRVLVKNQTTGSENGIYLVSSGSWTRTVDASQGTLTSGAMCLVMAGSVNSGSQWYLNTPDPITVGTTSLTFIQWSAGASYAFSDGLLNTAGTVTVKPDVGISVSSSGVAVDTTVVARKFSQLLSTSATSYTVSHNLNTLDVHVVLRNVSTGGMEYASITATTVNSVQIDFASAPAANAYQVSVIG